MRLKSSMTTWRVRKRRVHPRNNWETLDAKVRAGYIQKQTQISPKANTTLRGDSAESNENQCESKRDFTTRRYICLTAQLRHKARKRERPSERKALNLLVGRV